MHVSYLSVVTQCHIFAQSQSGLGVESLFDIHTSGVHLVVEGEGEDDLLVYI